ncbi:SDR family oxidoreductase [Pseudonocardia nematodicida]|uniref:SDR family oxidoreductase n=1 Tax=Pseudonocardia nematodicida TaxID=1206997 RepID=A0ABV1KGX7_9PSEU
MTDLRDRVVLVFGAGSSGAATSNGQAAARAYARAGARVAAIDVDTTAAEQTAALIDGEGGTAVALTADVTDEASVAAAVQTATARLGTPDVLHNNVGAAILGGVGELDRAGWERALALNATGAFLTCTHVLPLMLAAGRGAIVNVSSVAGIRHLGYDYPGYMAGKAALNQLTVSVALSHARDGIRANAILPGYIDTPLVGNQLHAEDLARARAERDAASPTGRMGSPWDVARAAVFLASDAAAYVNGVCLPVDGGLSARA